MCQGAQSVISSALNCSLFKVSRPTAVTPDLPEEQRYSSSQVVSDTVLAKGADTSRLLK